jgi:hypothetical protein
MTSPCPLLFTILVLAAVGYASGCLVGGVAPPEDEDALCNGYDRPYVVPSFACNGNVLVTTTPACAYGKPPTTTEQDCGSDVCQVDVGDGAECAHPCTSNGDCAAENFCSSTKKTPDGRTECVVTQGRYSTCELANTRSCTAGLACLLVHRTTDPSVSVTSCLATCASNTDCSKDEYCSTIVVTQGGTKTCAFKGGDCDPSNPDSCFPEAACKPSGRLIPTGGTDAGAEAGSRAEYWCAP